MSDSPTDDSFSWKAADTTSDDLLRREWIVTNGLGGFSSAAITGALTRRYHGLLVSALPIPHGRVVMLTALRERIRLPDGSALLLAAQPGLEEVAEADGEIFRQNGLPVWRFQAGGAVIEKRILMPHQQNTVFVSYTLVSGTPKALLELRPLLRFRRLEAAVDKGWETPYRFSVKGEEYEISHPDLPPLCISLCSPGKAFQIEEKTVPGLHYPTEEERGEPAAGDLWSPGFFSLELRQGEPVTFMASTEPPETRDALNPVQAREYELRRRVRLLERAPREARNGFAAELVLAADQFIIEPAGRAGEAALAHAQGDDVRTVIAGYHWFTDWGRDTMISLEGLALDTGRPREAGCILRTFSRYVRDGLIPNMFPEGQGRGLYHTADATLWFFHALSRYVARTHDRTTLRELLPVLANIVDHHVRGTHFNIHMDAKDALLIQGQQGYQLTWMDAKTGERVMTPRRGKAVEINALWYNALILTANWMDEENDRRGGDYRELARRAKESFNARFWSEQNGYLFDVVDGEHGNDPACRPNQVFAISLPNPVLDAARWAPVLDTVKRELLTPVGLRSLSPKDPDYKKNYHGDLWARDAAYHQGTVWPWLIGPYVDALLKVHPEDKAGARAALEGFQDHWQEAGLGTISEIFDAEEPHLARGCIAQAWSVAEVLRVWLKTES